MEEIQGTDGYRYSRTDIFENLNLPVGSKSVEEMREIRDHYPKYVVTLDELAADNINGVKIVHLADFLLRGEL